MAAAPGEVSRRGFLGLLLAAPVIYSFPTILRPRNIQWLSQADEVTRLYHAGDLSMVSAGWRPLDNEYLNGTVVNCRCTILPVELQPPDLEFIRSRQRSIDNIARAFAIPPELIS